jgi:hypothetical protein
VNVFFFYWFAGLGGVSGIQAKILIKSHDIEWPQMQHLEGPLP